MGIINNKVAKKFSEKMKQAQNSNFDQWKKFCFTLKVADYWLAQHLSNFVVRELSTHWGLDVASMNTNSSIYDQFFMTEGIYVVKLKCGYGVMEVSSSGEGVNKQSERHLHVPLWKRDAFIAEIEEILPKYNNYSSVELWSSSNRRHFHLSPKYGEREQFVRARDYKLVDDAIQNMLKGPEEYFKRGKEFKETILLYGPPGTAKSTMIRHFAAKYQCDMVITKPEKVLSLSLNRPDDSKPYFVLFEDFDSTKFLTKEGDNSLMSDIGEGADYGTFINWLEGIEPLNNVIVFMTTNHLEKIIESVYRSGRVTRKIEMLPLTNQEIGDFIDPKWKDHIETLDKGALKITMIPDLREVQSVENFNEVVTALG